METFVIVADVGRVSMGRDRSCHTHTPGCMQDPNKEVELTVGSLQRVWGRDGGRRMQAIFLHRSSWTPAQESPALDASFSFLSLRVNPLHLCDLGHLGPVLAPAGVAKRLSPCLPEALCQNVQSYCPWEV